MSHHHDESCHSSHCCGECHCGEGCSCHSHECGSSCSHGDEKFTTLLLELADEAWMEVLKDKIKEEIVRNNGEQLTALAKLVSTTNHKRWGAKMHAKASCEEFESQLREVMWKGSPNTCKDKCN